VTPLDCSNDLSSLWTDEPVELVVLLELSLESAASDELVVDELVELVELPSRTDSMAFWIVVLMSVVLVLLDSCSALRTAEAMESIFFGSMPPGGGGGGDWEVPLAFSRSLRRLLIEFDVLEVLDVSVDVDVVEDVWFCSCCRISHSAELPPLMLLIDILALLLKTAAGFYGLVTTRPLGHAVSSAEFNLFIQSLFWRQSSALTRKPEENLKTT